MASADMKVAYLLGSLDRGGTETLLLDTLRNAHSHGISPVLIYRKQGTLETEFLKLNIPVYHLAPRSRIDISYFWRLRQLLRHERCEVVHAQQPLDALSAYFVRLGLSFRLVLSFHGYDFEKGRVGKSIINFIIRRVDCTVYVSNIQRLYYQKQYGLNQALRQEVIYNGIDMAKFSLSIPVSIRQELKINEKTLLLGSVGNFVAVRDHLTVCHFLNKLKNSGIDFKFLFVGGMSQNAPQMYEACLAYCKEQDLMDMVYFLGVRSDVPAILTQLDAFVYATNHDTFGIAVVEALASGVPVLVNDWEVMREVTEEGRFGILYQTKDVDDMLVKFRDILQKRTYFVEKSMADAIIIKEKYGIASHISSLKLIYQKLIHSGD